MRTFEPMLSPGPLSWEPLAAPASRRWLRWFLPVVTSLALLAVANYPVPYFVLAPGTARQINDLVKLPEGRSFPPRGKVLLTTVSLVSNVRVMDLVLDTFDDDTESVPEERILGTTPKAELRQVNLQAMDTSKQTAIVIALRRVGFTVPEHGEGALVEQVFEEIPGPGGKPVPVPAAQQLNAGDVIKAVDGRPTLLVQDAQNAIRSRKPGERLRLDVVGADGQARVEEVLLLERPDTKVAFLGVQLSTKALRFDLPFPVEIESLGIGGPSAGLAYTLAVIDALTPGELTGGRNVAVTGTIEADGRVGDVGGVAQKTAAVRASGASVFLVPPGEFEQARKRAGKKLKVVKVATLEDALSALGRLGGDLRPLEHGAQVAQG